MTSERKPRSKGARPFASPPMSRLLAVLTLFALAALTGFYYAALDTYHSLSPQGCRMSWMWPSYVLQSKFDRTWTPLAQRYSLWLYREGNLENNQLVCT